MSMTHLVNLNILKHIFHQNPYEKKTQTQTEITENLPIFITHKTKKTVPAMLFKSYVSLSLIKCVMKFGIFLKVNAKKNFTSKQVAFLYVTKPEKCNTISTNWLKQKKRAHHNGVQTSEIPLSNYLYGSQISFYHM